MVLIIRKLLFDFIMVKSLIFILSMLEFKNKTTDIFILKMIYIKKVVLLISVY